MYCLTRIAFNLMIAQIVLLYLVFFKGFDKVSSSIHQKKKLNSENLRLCDFSLFSLDCTFIYEAILIKNVYANMIKTHLFYKMKLDLKGL